MISKVEFFSKTYILILVLVWQIWIVKKYKSEFVVDWRIRCAFSTPVPWFKHNLEIEGSVLQTLGCTTKVSPNSYLYLTTISLYNNTYRTEKIKNNDVSKRKQVSTIKSVSFIRGRLIFVIGTNLQNMPYLTLIEWGLPSETLHLWLFGREFYFAYSFMVLAVQCVIMLCKTFHGTTRIIVCQNNLWKLIISSSVVLNCNNWNLQIWKKIVYIRIKLSK